MASPASHSFCWPGIRGSPAFELYTQPSIFVDYSLFVNLQEPLLPLTALTQQNYHQYNHSKARGGVAGTVDWKWVCVAGGLRLMRWLDICKWDYTTIQSPNRCMCFRYIIKIASSVIRRCRSIVELFQHGKNTNQWRDNLLPQVNVHPILWIIKWKTSKIYLGR